MFPDLRSLASTIPALVLGFTLVLGVSLRAGECQGTETSTPTLPPPIAQEDLHFRIVNRASATMTGLYIVQPGSRSWERNIFQGTLAPGAVGEVLIQDKLPICVYDILATFSDGGRYEERNVDICDLDGEDLILVE